VLDDHLFEAQSPSSQQTQKSFSTITIDADMRAAVCANASARRSGGGATNCDASFAIRVSIRSQGAQRGLHPAGCQRQVIPQGAALVRVVSELEQVFPRSPPTPRLSCGSRAIWTPPIKRSRRFLTSSLRRQDTHR
jgi:hypothetical protein